MMWIDDPIHNKWATDRGFGKDHLKCNEIGHVLMPMLDPYAFQVHMICFNCGKDDKNQQKDIPKWLPTTVPIWKYRIYTGVNTTPYSHTWEFP